MLVRAGLIGFASLFAIGGSGALAVHEDLEFPAAIHEGTCLEPGDEVVALDDLTRLPEGSSGSDQTPAGAEGSQVVHGLPDGSTLDLTIDELFADDHILVVFDAAGEVINACGAIGAYDYEDGDTLSFGLRSQNDSPYVGAVVLTPLEDEDNADEDAELDIDIFLVNNTPFPPETPVADDATPVADDVTPATTDETPVVDDDATPVP